MTAIERIKEIEELLLKEALTWKDPLIIEQMDANKEQRQFLLKAFKVMREIAINNSSVLVVVKRWGDKIITGDMMTDREFEERMK